MMGHQRQDSLRREESFRDEITCAIGTSEEQTHMLSAQVPHLAKSVSTLKNQIDTNAEFSVDAMEQIRREIRTEIDANNHAKNSTDQASNAGGKLPGSSSDTTPLVNIMGKPAQTKSDEYATQCSYCLGSVPKVVAKHCIDCDLYFHLGHYQPHRDEWPCPLVDHDLCH